MELDIMTAKISSMFWCFLSTPLNLTVSRDLFWNTTSTSYQRESDTMISFNDFSLKLNTPSFQDTSVFTFTVETVKVLVSMFTLDCCPGIKFWILPR